MEKNESFAEDGNQVDKELLYRALVQELCGPFDFMTNTVMVMRTLLEKPEEVKRDRLLSLTDALWDSLLVANRLAGNMRDLSASNGLEDPETIGEVELRSLLKIIVQILGPYAKREGVELELDAGCDLWVKGDMAMAERVIVSLLGNLVMAGLGQGKIRVELTAREEKAVFTIQDDRPCVGKGRTILGEGEPAPDNAGWMSLYLAKRFCTKMGWELEVSSGQENAGFAIAAPVYGGSNTLLLRSAGEDLYQKEQQQIRIRREIEILLGKLK